VAVTNNRQQADTGTKMIHLGKIPGTIVSKAYGGATTLIAAGQSQSQSRRREIFPNAILC
jgi:Fe-S cluster assembly scaffold protein SufB